VCAVAVGISMIAKNELMSIVVSFMILFGLDSIISYDSIFSSSGRFTSIFGYFEQITHGSSTPIFVNDSFEKFVGPIVFPLLTAVIVLVVVFVYFTRKMEVD
jgi:hypothetical protein